MAKLSRTIPVTLVVLGLMSLPLVQCNHDNCEELRNELTTQKNEWAKCTRSEECVMVGGNVDDCTGIMACNFAVHRQHRLSAERLVASLPEDTVDCMVCGTPNCERGNLPYCEPVSGRCMIVSELITEGVEDKDLGIAVQDQAGQDDPPDDAVGEGGATSFGSQQPGLGGQAGDLER